MEIFFPVMLEPDCTSAVSEYCQNLNRPGETHRSSESDSGSTSSRPANTARGP